MNKIVAKIIALLASFYVVAYVTVRLKTNIIVHGYRYVDCKYDSHNVELGDFGIGVIEISGSAQTGYKIQPDEMPSRIEWFFTPLRFAELGYWYITQPAGSPIPKQDRKVLQCN
ncbi:hypothetical protein BV378_20455 [Nostoc sp. RF31YmG]|jgi:hypothetical protein|nr:hypothetical protein BV378_20455 [Nostoc sp. RF31YmG]